VNADRDTRGRPTRVMIVDDERQNRELLGIMLAPEGFAVVTAASGADALALVAREPPDIVLLDVMMPGLDGYQVAAALKGDAATRHIPVILLTGLDDAQARTLGSTAGADDFLSRPVDREELCARLRALTGKAGGRESRG
jgi:DNA-binding response OmpR family regulator